MATDGILDFFNEDINVSIDANDVNTIKVALCDKDGNGIGSLGGAINVHDADVHREIVNKQFHQDTATATTLAVASSAGDYQLQLTDATGFSVGDYVHVGNGTYEKNFPVITAIATNTITVNRPLDNAYSIGDNVNVALVNMNANATQASPSSFKAYPKAGEVYHLTRILIEMTHPSAGDNGLFGGIAELTNGVVLRRYDGTLDKYDTFTVWRTNSDIVTDMFDVVYSARSGGGGAYGTNCRGTFTNASAIVYLDGDAGDYLEILVQDNISSLTSFRIKAQGHIEGV